MHGAIIAFSWNGLPQYAARLLKHAIKNLGYQAVVIGSRPTVPIEGMEQALGQPVHWIDADSPVSWRDLGMDPPRIFFQSGWAYPGFKQLGREVKSAGGIVIGLSDANWRRDFRQLVLGALAFRLIHRRNFDGMIVPGAQGRKLMRYFGVPDNRIETGMYGADDDLFTSDSALHLRPKQFLFVGQFIERKNVLLLCRAFLRFHVTNPEWKLRLVGSGEQRRLLPEHPQIIIEDFVQPEALAEKYRQSRFFVLPSKVEAWGLVVHEAALCGCGLILSDAVGSADDLASSENSISFAPSDEDGLVSAMIAASNMNQKELSVVQFSTQRHAANFGKDKFAAAVMTFYNKFFGDDFRRNMPEDSRR